MSTEEGGASSCRPFITTTTARTFRDGLAPALAVGIGVLTAALSHRRHVLLYEVDPVRRGGAGELWDALVVGSGQSWRWL